MPFTYDHEFSGIEVANISRAGLISKQDSFWARTYRDIKGASLGQAALGIGIAPTLLPKLAENLAETESLMAVFRQTNDIVAPISYSMAKSNLAKTYLSDPANMDYVDLRYKPSEDPSIREEYLYSPEAFDTAGNPEKGQLVAALVRREIEDWDYINQEGAGALPLMFGSGILSPLTFVPVAGWAKNARSMRKIQRQLGNLQKTDDIPLIARMLAAPLSKREELAFANRAVDTLETGTQVNVSLKTIREAARHRVLGQAAARSAELGKRARIEALVGIPTNIALGAGTAAASEAWLAQYRASGEDYIAEAALMGGGLMALFSISGAKAAIMATESASKVSKAFDSLNPPSGSELTWRFGVPLEFAEAEALSLGRVDPEALAEAKKAVTILDDQAEQLRQQRLVEEEEALLQEFQSLNNEKNLTNQDLLEFYQQQVRLAEAEGREVPVLPGARDFDAEDAALLAEAEAIRAQPGATEETITKELSDLRNRRITTADLLEFWIQEVRVAKREGKPIPLLPGQKSADEINEAFLVKLDEEVKKIQELGARKEPEIDEKIRILNEQGPTARDLREWWNETVDDEPQIPVPLQLIRERFEQMNEQAIMNGEGQILTPRHRRLLEAKISIQEKKSGKPIDVAGLQPPVLRILFGPKDKPKPLPSRGQLLRFWEEKSAQGTIRTEDIAETTTRVAVGGEVPTRIVTPREERLQLALDLARREREGAPIEVTPVFRGRTPATREQLLEFYRQRRANAVRSDDVTVPRQQELGLRLRLMREERQNLPTAEFSPVVRMPDGSFKPISVAERYEQAYTEGFRRVQNRTLLDEIVTKSGIDAVDGDVYAKYFDPPEVDDPVLIRMIEDELDVLAKEKDTGSVAPRKGEATLKPEDATGGKPDITAVRPRLPGEGTMIGRLFFKTLRLSPQNRLHLNRFAFIADAGRALVNNGLMRNGFVRSDIASRIRGNLAQTTNFAHRLRALYSSGKKVHGLSEEQWGHELYLRTIGVKNNNLSSEAAEAIDSASAEWRKIMDAWRERELSAGLITEEEIAEIKKLTGEDYLPRFWDWEYIELNREKFVGIIKEKTDRTLQQAEIFVDQLLRDKDNIGMFDHHLDPKRASVHRDRTLAQLKSQDFIDFIHTDPTYILSKYGREAGARVEYAALTPKNPSDGMNLVSLKKSIREAYAEEMKKNPKKKNLLRRERDAVLADFEFIRKSQLSLPFQDSFYGAGALLAVPKAVASIAYLPLAGLAASADLASIAFHAPMSVILKSATRSLAHRVKAWAGETPTGALDWELRALEYAHSDLAKTGILLDYTGRHSTSRPIRDARSLGDMVSNAAAKTSDFFYLLSGMKLMTSFAQQTAGHGYAHLILSAALNPKSLTKVQVEDLARIGVSDEFLKRLRPLLQDGVTYKKDLGLLVPNLQELPSDLADEFRNSVFTGARQTVPTPGQIEVPRVFSSEFGSVVAPYMSFIVDSTTKYLGRGLVQQSAKKDQRVVAGLVALVGMGVLNATMRRALRGELDDDWTTEDMVMEGIHMSGVGGIYMELNDYLSKGTAGTVDIANLIGATTTYERYGANRSEIRPPVLAVFPEMVRDMRNIYEATFGDGVTEEQMQRLGRRTPVLNLPGMNSAFRMWIETLND